MGRVPICPGCLLPRTECLCDDEPQDDSDDEDTRPLS